MFEKKIRLPLSLVLVAGLSACSTTTSIQGTINDPQGKPVHNAKVKLDDEKTAKSDANGKFNLSRTDSCFIMCAGGDSILMIKKAGYKTIHDYIPQFKKVKRTYQFKLNP